jgi:hypothetical protein
MFYGTQYAWFLTRVCHIGEYVDHVCEYKLLSVIFALMHFIGKRV